MDDLERWREWLWQARAIETPCERCYGAGVRSYPGTSTWRGGVGGNMMTTDVCDACWGTGDAHRRGIDLRAVLAQQSEVERLTKERDEARMDVDRLLALLRRVVEAEDDDASPFYCNPYRRHAHVVEGVWDSDNGPKAGTGCAVCALWAEVRAVIAAELGAAR